MKEQLTAQITDRTKMETFRTDALAFQARLATDKKHKQVPDFDQPPAAPRRGASL